MAFFQPLEHTQKTYEKQTSIEFLLDSPSSKKETPSDNGTNDPYIKHNRIELPSPSSFCSEPLIYDNSYPSSNFSQTHDRYHKYHKRGLQHEHPAKSPMEIQYLKRIKALMVLVDRQTKEIKNLREALDFERSRNNDDDAKQ
jgi:hypothetical protein